MIKYIAELIQFEIDSEKPNLDVIAALNLVISKYVNLEAEKVKGKQNENFNFS